MSSTQPQPHSESRWAPFVVFGGILLIGTAGLLVVGISQCRREEPMLNPIMMAPGNPDRLDSPGHRAERQRQLEKRKREREQAEKREAEEAKKE